MSVYHILDVSSHLPVELVINFYWKFFFSIFNPCHYGRDGFKMFDFQGHVSTPYYQSLNRQLFVWKISVRRWDTHKL